MKTSPSMIENKAIERRNLDSSKVSGPDCIPVVALKNCEHELSYILPELLNICLKESCFPDCWKVSLVVPVFKNVGERTTVKSYRVISIFLRVIVLQADSSTERINKPTFHVNSPTKPILAVFSPTNRWSYSPVGLSTQWSRPVYHKPYFM